MVMQARPVEYGHGMAGNVAVRHTRDRKRRRGLARPSKPGVGWVGKGEETQEWNGWTVAVRIVGELEGELLTDTKPQRGAGNPRTN